MRCLIAVVVCVLLAGVSSHAQLVVETTLFDTLSDLEKELRDSPEPPPKQSSKSEENAKRVWDSFDTLRAEEQRRTAITGNVTFGFSGDRTSQNDESKATFGAKVTGGSYPNQLRFGTEASVRLRDGELEEDVTSTFISYDYYLDRNWETFAFLERFTDSFLRIDERYEVGFGIEFERNSGESFVNYLLSDELSKLGVIDKEVEKALRRDATAKCVEGHLKSGCDKMINAAVAAKILASPIANDVTPTPARQSLANASDTLSDVYHSLHKSSSRWEYGLSAALLSEFEQPDTLKSFLLDEATMMRVADSEVEFRPSSTQTFRLSVRPSFVFRFSEFFSLRSDVYYRHSLEDDDGDLPEDYRIDAISRAQWKLGKLLPTSKKTVTLEFRHEWRYDNRPPSFELSSLELDPGQSLETVQAPKIHRIYRLNLVVAL